MAAVGGARGDPSTVCRTVSQSRGFVSLNVLFRTRPCAGLDQQPAELGGRAVEMLIAQLQRNELGVPEWATTTTIPARWTEGPTVRKLPGSPVQASG